jgi:hypothetical protein
MNGQQVDLEERGHDVIKRQKPKKGLNQHSRFSERDSSQKPI